MYTYLYTVPGRVKLCADTFDGILHLKMANLSYSLDFLKYF